MSNTGAEPSFVVETLAWCNERRAERGQPPLDRLPKGERWNSVSCPCGKATGLYVDNDAFAPSLPAWRDEGIRVPLPERVRVFVAEFDGGYLPQYDADADVGGEQQGSGESESLRDSRGGET